MKHIYVSLLSVFCCMYALTSNAQQLVATAGEDSPIATWAIGEVIGAHYQSDDCMVIQGILSYVSFSSLVGLEDNDWQDKTAIWPNSVSDYINVCIPQYNSPIQVRIYSSNGMLAKQFRLLRSKETFDLSFLAPGMYAVRLIDIDGKAVITPKIIKL